MMKVISMSQSHHTDVPLSIKIAVVVSLAQVIYLLVTTVLGVIASEDMGASLVIAAFYILIALALAVGSIALWQGRRFGQPLVLVWQLFALIIGVQSAVGGQLFWGIITATLSGIVVLATCAKTSIEYVTPKTR